MTNLYQIKLFLSLRLRFTTVNIEACGQKSSVSTLMSRESKKEYNVEV